MLLKKNKQTNKSYSDLNTDLAEAMTIKALSKAVIKGKTGIKKEKEKWDQEGSRNGILFFHAPCSVPHHVILSSEVAKWRQTTNYRQLVVD